MLATVLSKNQKPIRLTEERWSHIVEGHSELVELPAEVLQTVVEPTKILAGCKGEQLETGENP